MTRIPYPWEGKGIWAVVAAKTPEIGIVAASMGLQRPTIFPSATAMETVMRTTNQVQATTLVAMTVPGNTMFSACAEMPKRITEAPSIPQITPLELPASRASEISTSSPNPEAHLDLPLYDLLDGHSDPRCRICE